MLLQYLENQKFKCAANLEKKWKQNTLILHAPISLHYAYLRITNLLTMSVLISVKYSLK